MTFDIGEVLSQSWQISWKNKRLWLIGILLSLFVLLIFPLMLAPLSIPVLIETQNTELALFVLLGFAVVFSVFNILIYIVSPLAQTSVTLGVIHAHEGEPVPHVVELIKKSFSYFWRILGILLLYSIVLSLILFVIQMLAFIITLATFGFGSICATPLTILAYPAIFLLAIWQEQTTNAVIVDNYSVTDAIKVGWQIIRKNVMVVFLVIIVVYFGISMITSIFMMPMFIPLFAIFFSFLTGDPNQTVILISVLASLLIAPVFAIINGWGIVFTKSAMILTYLRIKPSSNAPLAVEATA